MYSPGLLESLDNDDGCGLMRQDLTCSLTPSFIIMASVLAFSPYHSSGASLDIMMTESVSHCWGGVVVPVFTLKLLPLSRTDDETLLTPVRVGLGLDQPLPESASWRSGRNSRGPRVARLQ